MRIIKNFWIWIYFYLIIFHLTSGALIAPKLYPDHYFYPGNINLGVIGYLHSETSTGFCGCGKLLGNDIVQQPEAIYYTVNNINHRHNILPGLKLGFVFMDGCLSPSAGSARAIYFIEESNKTCSSSNNKGVSPSSCSNNLPFWFETGNLITDFTHYKVAGVLGPPSSGEAVTVGALLSAFEIPVLGTFSSSDQLSNKNKFKYFSRLVPPDNFQTQAMVDLLKYFEWSYVSLLYAEGSYGENAGKQFTKWVKTHNDICIAFSYMIPNNPDKDEINHIADNLEKNKNARVIALFAAGVETLFLELDNRNLTGHFIWLGSDTVAGFEHGSFAHLTEGMLYLTFEGVGRAPNFEKYFKSLNPWNATSGNPWLVKAWENIFSCKWNGLNATDPESCYFYSDFGEDNSFRIGMTIGKLIDGINVYAHALDSLINSQCPEAFINQTLLDTCVTGEKVLTYLRNVSFEGVTGTIKFDSKGDILGAYSIIQIQRVSNKEVGYYGKTVGMWDKITETVTIDLSSIQWPFKEYNLDQNKPAVSLNISTPPASLCSRPCGPKFYRIQQELPCCWLCRLCRSNEKITKNFTACEQCPLNTWPDDSSLTCLQISESYLRPQDAISIGLIIMATLGIMLWTTTTVIFIKKRHEKLIKACNLELSLIILAGALIALITVYAYVARPTKLSCVFREVGFHMSVNILFGPLLVKTNRVYRIFESGKKSVQRPPFITAAAQRVFTGIACIIQVSVHHFIIITIIILNLSHQS